jgi:lambda family phage portal protein
VVDPYAIAKIFSRITEHQQPVLYGADGKLIYPDFQYRARRRAAYQEGSLNNWRPIRTTDEKYERENISSRASDLFGNDAHAQGIIKNFASTIIGSGLNPHPCLNSDIIGLSKEQIKIIEKQEISVFKSWSSYADAGERLNFGEILFLIQCNMIQFGEYILILPMVKDESRPYSIACQVIHPMRLSTPSDLTQNDMIKDGVEIGAHGKPVAYWIKKTNDYRTDSKAYTRVRAKWGHRHRVLHGFIQYEPEQTRGISEFSSAMKLFRDHADLLDAELVSSVVSAAISMFIETTPIDPIFPAENFATNTETNYKNDGTSYNLRYQEFSPGQIMYGREGQRPHLLSPERPGITFEPFVKIIRQAISMSVGIPYNVLFSDFTGMNYASYRSAMLDAWRVYKMRRTWIGQDVCQPIFTMLMEEAWLRDKLNLFGKDFYEYMHEITRADFIGPPKGQIEPVKEISADVMAYKNNLKTQRQIILEQGGDIDAVYDQLADEKNMRKEKGLDEQEQEGNLNNNEPK